MLQAFAFLVLPGELGLEVCAGKGTSAKEAMKSGMWHPCDPVEGTITVNVGDALQYWSDDRLKSTFHPGWKLQRERGGEGGGGGRTTSELGNVPQ